MYVVHGGWSDPIWIPCRNGRRLSFPRSCNNPKPALGGKYCEGDSILIKPCEDMGWLGGRSVEAGGNVFELELEGFSICNTDGTEGLTFDEINACRVNYNFTRYVDT